MAVATDFHRHFLITEQRVCPITKRKLQMSRVILLCDSLVEKTKTRLFDRHLQGRSCRRHQTKRQLPWGYKPLCCRH